MDEDVRSTSVEHTHTELPSPGNMERTGAGLGRLVTWNSCWHSVGLPWVLHHINMSKQQCSRSPLFSESFWDTMWCCYTIWTSAGAFARPSLLFHVDDCPQLKHRPTIGSNWHIALAVLGEIWEPTRPRTGCPFHQLVSCLLMGWGLGVVYLTGTLSLDQNDLWRSFFPLCSLLLRLSLSLSFSVSLHRGNIVCELLLRVFRWDPLPETDSCIIPVSGTFTLELLWQSDCGQASNQLCAAGLLKHYSLSLYQLFFFFLSGYVRAQQFSFSFHSSGTIWENLQPVVLWTILKSKSSSSVHSYELLSLSTS